MQAKETGSRGMYAKTADNPKYDGQKQTKMGRELSRLLNNSKTVADLHQTANAKTAQFE